MGRSASARPRYSWETHVVRLNLAIGFNGIDIHQRSLYQTKEGLFA